MTQIKISKILEVAKFLATTSGKELEDFIQYVSDLADQMVRAMRNGLSVADNLDAKFLTVNLAHNVTSAVNVGSRRAKMILTAQVLSVTYGLDTFHWYVDADGSTKVRMTFTGSPAATLQIPVVLLISYG